MLNINLTRSATSYSPRVNNEDHCLSNQVQETYDSESIAIDEVFFDADSEFYYDAKDNNFNDPASCSQNQKNNPNDTQKSQSSTEGTASAKTKDSSSIPMSEDFQRFIHNMIDKIGELGGRQLISRICNYMIPELPLNQLNLMISSYNAISKGEDIDMVLLHGSGMLITALELEENIKDAIGSLSSGYIDANSFGNVGDTAKQYIEAICYIFLMVSLFAKKTPDPERAIFRIPLVMTDILKKAYQTVSIISSYLAPQKIPDQIRPFEVASQIVTQSDGNNGAEHLLSFQANSTLHHTNDTLPMRLPPLVTHNNSMLSLSDEVNKRLVTTLANKQFGHAQLQCDITKQSSV